MAVALPGYVAIPTQDCASNPQVLFHPYATQWPIGPTAGPVSLYFEWTALKRINGGNYSAIIRWNGYPVVLQQHDNSFLSTYTGIFPIPAGYQFNYTMTDVATVIAGSYNVIAFDIQAVDQNGTNLMCVKNPPFTPPANSVAIPLANCVDEPAAYVNAYASAWPPVSGPLYLAIQLVTTRAVAGGTYDFLVTTSLGTVISSSSDTIYVACGGGYYCPTPLPAGYEVVIGYTINVDATTLPPGATVNIALTARDETGALILCLGNGSTKATHISVVVVAMSLFLTAKHLFQF